MLENWLHKWLFLADMHILPENYLFLTYKYALFISFAGLFLIPFFGLTAGVLMALLLGIITFGIAMYIPVARAHFRAKYFERDLPVLLRTLAVELSINIPFDIALRHIARTQKGVVAKEFKRALYDVDNNGRSIPEALNETSHRIDSIFVKRAIVQLIHLYRTGQSSSEVLYRLARELFDVQKSVMQQYVGKTTLYTLLFIVISAVLPGFFQVLITVGSMFLNFSMTPLQAFLIPALAFPLVDTLVMVFMIYKTPVFMR